MDFVEVICKELVNRRWRVADLIRALDKAGATIRPRTVYAALNRSWKERNGIRVCRGQPLNMYGLAEIFDVLQLDVYPRSKTEKDHRKRRAAERQELEEYRKQISERYERFCFLDERPREAFACDRLELHRRLDLLRKIDFHQWALGRRVVIDPKPVSTDEMTEACFSFDEIYEGRTRFFHRKSFPAT